MSDCSINWRDLRPHETRSEYKERIRKTEEDLESLFSQRDKACYCNAKRLAEALGEMLALLEDHACLDGMSLEELTLWLRAQRTLKQNG
jgi:hypothetical protein